MLTETDGTGTYKNLPGRLANQEARLTSEAEGFEPVDTVVTLQRNGEVNLSIQRDDTYGVLAGNIIDENGQTVGGAMVEAEGIINMEANNNENKGTRVEQTYRCNDCGNTIYKHEVFCSKCGKLLDKYDFED